MHYHGKQGASYPSRTMLKVYNFFGGGGGVGSFEDFRGQCLSHLSRFYAVPRHL